jgi:aspartate-semialdehyde dehydrogenase
LLLLLLLSFLLPCSGGGGIIANPNCSTIIALMAVTPLHKVAKVKRMIVSTYQAASGAGAAAMEELKEQTRDVLEGREAKPVIFPYQVGMACGQDRRVMLEAGGREQQLAASSS